MGILDDAIREHLELKRSHGASDEEISRQEAEVFGPARAEVAPQGAAPAVADEEHAQLLTPEGGHPDADALQAAPEDEYTPHPGDDAVPDTHDHLHPAGSDPAWGEDTKFFAEQPHEQEHAPPAAEAGAGLLEGHHVEPGPPVSPEHHHHHYEDDPHPALVDHEHIGGEEHPPEPVFGRSPEAPTGPAPEAQEGEGEDVLEETPEFLQDAPEHDRLWFEQKPPRDFDFGE
jgi:hypothetical protein